jgi:hypothetical protein
MILFVTPYTSFIPGPPIGKRGQQKVMPYQCELVGRR